MIHRLTLIDYNNHRNDIKPSLMNAELSNYTVHVYIQPTPGE